MSEVTINKDGGIVFHDDPLATALANKPATPKEPETKWLPKEKKVDEWARVQAMRKNHPTGLVAGGCASESESEDYDAPEPKMFEKGLRGIGQGKKNQEARHWSSN